MIGIGGINRQSAVGQIVTPQQIPGVVQDVNVAVFGADEYLGLTIAIDVLDAYCLDMVMSCIVPQTFSIPLIGINAVVQAGDHDLRRAFFARYERTHDTYALFRWNLSFRALQVAAIDEKLFSFRTDYDFR